MNKNFLNKMKKRLLEERKVIVIKALAEDQQIDCDGDEADEIQANLIIYLNNQMHSRYKSSIDKIDNALNKIEKNEYGDCEECGEKISDKRLEFNPYFSHCIVCAEIKEKESRR
jgi:DnaK suppressor protein